MLATVSGSLDFMGFGRALAGQLLELIPCTKCGVVISILYQNHPFSQIQK